ncbi:MAG: hypothetical protein GXN99_03095 [Candidatus Nanohaloarchaeota archaeon]|nr:hypothetical protein [Candidatus Nanohaloarchaeota archaeon]
MSDFENSEYVNFILGEVVNGSIKDFPEAFENCFDYFITYSRERPSLVQYEKSIVKGFEITEELAEILNGFIAKDAGFRILPCDRYLIKMVRSESISGEEDNQTTGKVIKLYPSSENKKISIDYLIEFYFLGEKKKEKVSAWSNLINLQIEEQYFNGVFASKGVCYTSTNLCEEKRILMKYELLDKPVPPDLYLSDPFNNFEDIEGNILKLKEDTFTGTSSMHVVEAFYHNVFRQISVLKATLFLPWKSLPVYKNLNGINVYTSSLNKIYKETISQFFKRDENYAKVNNRNGNNVILLTFKENNKRK